MQDRTVIDGAEPKDGTQAKAAVQAMWVRVHSLQERVVLLRRLAGVSKAVGDDAQARVGLCEAQRVRAQVLALIECIEGERSSA